MPPFVRESVSPTMHSSPRIQAHTFIRWINNNLVRAQKPLVRSLVRDLQDAVPLISLVEICLGKEVPFEYIEKSEDPVLQHENWKSFLSFLVEEKVIDEKEAGMLELPD